ncbi:ABC transporter substrate-binding protein [Acidiferrimicrobium sp. IK]|uniref:ABC transporter substrate-binding protein n=1 Tax=Acidiferrimicrobium sp. IK TaxID=2871700 RepID=UPI0021CB0629|nr:ABC transporter substrate-binding protein [Acidiferrimicrobium sp. IK]MCU4182848.1 ABC transporter substrate-binding protein [Acidiferrimicrobium sp. IK]
MKLKRYKAVASLTVAAAVVAGCGSSSSTNSSAATAASATTGAGPAAGSGGADKAKVYTIGVLADETGPGASANKSFLQGAQAGIGMEKADGWKFNYVVGDTATSPATALTAAHQLVDQDHVDVVLVQSAVAFGAAPYLTKQGIPVVGVAQDANEWLPSKNMFSDFGFLNDTVVTQTAGKFFKLVGATKVGTLGYSISPSSADSARAAAISAQAAGLAAPYVNPQFPFGSTNIAPEALAMKNAGIDALYASVDPNTGLALINALRQLGDSPKAPYLATGYGGDLLQAGPAGEQSAQGVYFTTSFEPIEMNTPATQKFAAALKAVGVTTEATYGEYNGYVSTALLAQGLAGAGSNETKSSLIASLSGITNFDGAGLLGTHTLDLSNRQATAGGIDGCSYFTQFEGTTFHLVAGADPLCGSVIPGKVAGSS